MIAHSLPIDYRASIARGFNVSLASTVHLAAIMIYEAAPLSRTVSAKLEMRPYIHEPSTFFEIASFASASPTYRSIMRPLNVPRPLLHPGSFAMWPGRPPRRPRRATCRVVGRLECVYERARYYRPNTGHREPSLLASTRARLSLVFTGSGLRWVCPGERKGLVSLFFEISRRGRVGTGWTACLFDSSGILFLIREEVIVFLRMFRREGIGSLYVTFFSSRKK